MSIKNTLQIIQAQMIEEGGYFDYYSKRILITYMNRVYNVITIIKIDTDAVMIGSSDNVYIIPNKKDDYVVILPINNISITIDKDDPLVNRIKKSIQDLAAFI